MLRPVSIILVLLHALVELRHYMLHLTDKLHLSYLMCNYQDGKNKMYVLKE